jgi:uncharacterized heparinase superfamily protein
MSIMRLLRTVRHLRGQQIAGQIVHRARRSIQNPAKVLTWKVPSFPGVAWKPTAPFLPPAGQQNVTSGRLTFLNQTYELGWPPRWDVDERPKLWQYNLHYFEYIWSLHFDEARRIAIHWIERYAPARGSVGWESYPTSLRLINWCCVFFQKHLAQIESDTSFREVLWSSMHRQAQWLEQHLETHLLGNHLLENAAALTVVGTCFGEASWRGIGMDLLRHQLPEQILADGGHFERSPMYHCRVVYLLKLLQNIGDDELTRLVDDPLKRAMAALGKMCHPDGRIALLNDSAFGIYNEPAELGATLPPAGNFSLPDTGYYGARTADGSYLICDAGPIGPDHLPGHAHGDMLSFELSLRGHRVIVDSGVFDYVAGDIRTYCRSTRAHNTVEIDGQDQCEFWAAFRVARRGHVRDVKWSDLADGFELHASHDGYQRLPGGGATHARTSRWYNDGRLNIRDVITSPSIRNAVVRLHLHPECKVKPSGEHSSSVEYGGGSISVRFAGAGMMTVEHSSYCPEFGLKLPNPVIVWTATPSARIEIKTEISSGETTRG